MISRAALETLAVVVGLLATGGGLLAGVVAVSVRLILLPWLRDNLLGKLSDVHHQVTVNGHTSDEPTVLDSVDRVGDQLGTLSTQLAQLATDQHTMARVFDNHISWAERHRSQSRYVFRRRNAHDY